MPILSDDERCVTERYNGDWARNKTRCDRKRKEGFDKCAQCLAGEKRSNDASKKYRDKQALSARNEKSANNIRSILLDEFSVASEVYYGKDGYTGGLVLDDDALKKLLRQLGADEPS